MGEAMWPLKPQAEKCQGNTRKLKLCLFICQVLLGPGVYALVAAGTKHMCTSDKCFGMSTECVCVCSSSYGVYHNLAEVQCECAAAAAVYAMI